MQEIQTYTMNWARFSVFKSESRLNKNSPKCVTKTESFQMWIEDSARYVLTFSKREKNVSVILMVKNNSFPK